MQLQLYHSNHSQVCVCVGGQLWISPQCSISLYVAKTEIGKICSCQKYVPVKMHSHEYSNRSNKLLYIDFSFKQTSFQLHVAEEGSNHNQGLSVKAAIFFCNPWTPYFTTTQLLKYLFAVLYNWLHHVNFLVIDTYCTTCTLVPCVAFSEDCFPTRLKLFCWWSWRSR